MAGRRPIPSSDPDTLRGAVRAASRLGLVDVAALTTSIAPWLASHAFREVGRDDLAPAVHAADELEGACPTSARALDRDAQCRYTGLLSAKR